MKNLRKYCIEVNSSLERSIATTFMRRASKLPEHPNSDSIGPVVGIDSVGRKSVLCGWRAPEENPIPFRNIEILADTPSRKEALKAAYRIHNPAAESRPVSFAKVVEAAKEARVTLEKPKTPSKMLPVVTFWYPSSTTRQNVERKVRVVKADTIHIIGFDINKNEQFKKFKRAKVSGLVSLVAFNS